MAAAARIVLGLVFSVFLGLATAPAFAHEEQNRTQNRTVLGIPVTPDWLLRKPEHYEFTPQVSNHDPQNQHPAAWEGQDWDTSKWGRGWTSDSTLRKFFEARIFERQYMEDGKVPVLQVGPTFYKLSDLDQRRTLKLLTDHTGIFKKGHKVVELVDWSTHEIVGTYTPKGMFLN